MHSPAWILASCLIPLTTAHFLLNYPASRGFNEDQLSQFPCGGQSTISPNRTLWPLKGGPVQLNMQHDRVAVQVLLGLGNDVGSNFNITLMPIFTEEGFGDFCMGNVAVPSQLNIKDGQNATIQVVTSGDPNGGLYNCADITFTKGTPSPSTCTNGTGIKTTPYTGPFQNANGTNPSGTSPSSSSSASAPSTTTSAPATTSSSAVERMAASLVGLMIGSGLSAMLAL